MNSFELLLSKIFESKKYWVKLNYKVNLTKEEKVNIGRPSSPRWEIDLIAYKPKTNELLAIECKSYLDSQGVRISGFDGTNDKQSERFKLFNDELLRDIVLSRLVQDLYIDGLVPNDAVIPKLCLATGHLYSKEDSIKLKTHFGNNGWILYDEEWVKNELKSISLSDYEDDLTAIISKLLLR